MSDDINTARAYFYEFFSKPLSFIDEAEFEIWHKQAEILSQNLLDDALKEDFESVLDTDFAAFHAEQNAVFYDLSYVNVPISASFYHEGRDDGQMKLLARDLIRKSALRKDEHCTQSEDEFGFLFGFIAAVLKSDESVAQQCFRFVLNPVIDEFMQKLEIHKNSAFFVHLARIMRVFFAQERLFLGIEPPPKHEGKSLADKALERVPYEPKLPTKFSKINTEELTRL